MSNKINDKILEGLIEEYEELGGYMENINTNGSVVDIISQLQKEIIKIKYGN